MTWRGLFDELVALGESAEAGAEDVSLADLSETSLGLLLGLVAGKGAPNSAQRSSAEMARPIHLTDEVSAADVLDPAVAKLAQLAFDGTFRYLGEAKACSYIKRQIVFKLSELKRRERRQQAVGDQAPRVTPEVAEDAWAGACLERFFKRHWPSLVERARADRRAHLNDDRVLLIGLVTWAGDPGEYRDAAASEFVETGVSDGLDAARELVNQRCSRLRRDLKRHISKGEKRHRLNPNSPHAISPDEAADYREAIATLLYLRRPRSG